MRLRQLKLPLAFVHPQQVFGVFDWRWFNRCDKKQVLRGYFDTSVVIDCKGHEYRVSKVLIVEKPTWTSLPFSGGKSANIDFELIKERTLTIDQMRYSLMQAVTEGEGLVFAGETRLTKEEALGHFRGVTYRALIEDIGYFSADTYVPMPNEPSPRVVLERHKKR